MDIEYVYLHFHDSSGVWPSKKYFPVFAMKDNKHRSRMETPAPWRQVDMFIFNHYCIFVNSPSSNLISTYI